MLLTIASEECLSGEHVDDAAQPACQDSFAWGIVLALDPAAQTSQKPHLFLLQCHP
jgi:hypothetical protein